MSKTLSIILMILLYLLLALACFGIISYFSDLQLLSSIPIQLYIGLAALAASIILLIFMISKSKEIKMDSPKEKDENLQDDEDENNNLDQQIQNADEQAIEELEESESSETKEDSSDLKTASEDIIESNELNNDQENGNDQKQIQTYSNVIKLKNAQPISQGSFIDLSLINEPSDNQSIDLKATAETLSQPIEDNLKSANTNETASDASASASNTKEDTLDEMDVNKKTLDVIKESDPSLTETQIMYINNSDNSYLNTQGMPQLVITTEMNSKRFANEKRTLDQITKSEKSVEELEKEMAEERQYLKEERQEKIISLLLTFIIVGAIALVAIIGFTLYQRLIG